MGWNRNDSITSLLPNIFFLSRAKWLHFTKMWWSVRIHRQYSHRGGGSFLKIYECVRCVWETRIILPVAFRDRVLNLAQEDNLGVVNMKRKQQMKVRWSGLDAKVFRRICHSRQVVGMSSPPEPIKTTELSTGPWLHIAAHLITPPVDSNGHFFVVVDYYSNY